MTLIEDSFNEFLQPLVQRLESKNDHFREIYGPYRHWGWDPEAVTLTFSDSAKTTLRIDVTVVGTVEDDSWEWSWANPNFEPEVIRGMESVREFGEAHGYRRLTTDFLIAKDQTGWEMTAVAAHILNALGAYRFPTQGGYCYLIYRKIEEVAEEINLNEGVADSW